MNKGQGKIDVLKKLVSRLIKAAPARRPEPVDPLLRLIRAFMEYDCDQARADVAISKLTDNMVDNNELRVTPAIELAALLGVRYPFAESRCSALHRTLQSIFDREHHMSLARLSEMRKPEIRPYLQSLAGVVPYVEAAVCLDCYEIPAVPVDTKFLLWLISKDAFVEGIDIKTAQGILEKQIKSSEAGDLFHGSRREIDEWVPKSWPPVAKVYSPMLAPPPIGAPDNLRSSDNVPSVRVVAKEGTESKDGRKSAATPEKKSAAPSAKTPKPRKGKAAVAKRV